MAIVNAAYDAPDSDYGSDLDEEQEDLVNQVLGEIPNIPESTPPLVIRDIEDNEGPSGAKVPSALGKGRLQYYRASLRTDSDPLQSGAIIQIQLDGGGSAQSKAPLEGYYSALLTNVQADSRESRKP